MYNNNTREEISFLIIHTNNTYNITYQFIYLNTFETLITEQLAFP